MIISKKNDVYVKVDTEPNIARELVDFFTFEVPGARFMPTYKSRVWDGKIRLYNQMTGEIYFGLVPYVEEFANRNDIKICLLYTSPSPRDATLSRMPSSA